MRLADPSDECKSANSVLYPVASGSRHLKSLLARQIPFDVRLSPTLSIRSPSDVGLGVHAKRHAYLLTQCYTGL